MGNNIVPEQSLFNFFHDWNTTKCYSIRPIIALCIVNSLCTPNCSFIVNSKHTEKILVMYGSWRYSKTILHFLNPNPSLKFLMWFWFAGSAMWGKTTYKPDPPLCIEWQLTTPQMDHLTSPKLILDFKKINVQVLQFCLLFFFPDIFHFHCCFFMFCITHQILFWFFSLGGGGVLSVSRAESLPLLLSTE